MDLFTLCASIALDDSSYKSGLDDASKKTHSFGENLKKGLATAAKVGSAAITAVTGATTVMSKAFMDNVGGLAEYGDSIDKMSQKMGMSAQAYQEWDAVMQHSGTSIESLQAGMKTLANAVESGNKAFGRLGISQEQIASMNNEELFSATITALQNVENETERTYLAGQLLGRGATELGALLNTSAEDTQAMKDRVHELGGVMSDEAVKAAAAYQDSLQDMQTAFSGVSRGLIGNFLPSVTTVMDGLTEIFAGNGNTGIAMVTQGVSDFMGQLSETVPRVLEFGKQIISSFSGVIMENVPQILGVGAEILVNLVTGIISAVPTLVSAVPEIVSSIATAVSDNLSTILKAGGELLDMLTAGILEGIPAMLNMLPDVFTNLYNFLAENLPGVIEKGFDVLMSLVDGIIGAIPGMVAKLPEVIQAMMNYLTSVFPVILKKGGELLGRLIMGILGAIPEIAVQLPNVITAVVDAFEAGWGLIKGAGKYLLEGLWAGISDKVEWLKGKVGGVVDAIKSWFTGPSGFDEHSPSKWAAEVGAMVSEGLAKGIDKSSGKVKKSAEQIAKDTYSTLKEWADRQTKYLNLSYGEQVELWETIQGQFAKSSEQYADAEEKIFDLRAQALEEYQKRAESVYKENEALEKKYQDTLAKRTSEIFQSFGLFDEIPERQKQSGTALMENLRGQISSIQEFYGSLTALEERGAGGALVDEIRSMGIGAADELSALLSLTDDQLSEYSTLYGEKQALANEIAMEELEGLRTETESKIQENLDSLESLYEQKTPEVGIAFTDGLAEGIMSGMSSVIDAAVSVAQAAVEATKNTLGIHSPSRVFAGIGGNMALGLAEGWENELSGVRSRITRGMDFGTASVDFASSGLGMSSAAIINNVASGGDTGNGQPIVVNLQLPDGSNFATWQFPYLVKVASAAGTPITSTGYA